MQQTSIHAHPLLTQYIIGLGAPTTGPKGSLHTNTKHSTTGPKGLTTAQILILNAKRSKLEKPSKSRQSRLQPLHLTAPGGRDCLDQHGFSRLGYSCCEAYTVS